MGPLTFDDALEFLESDELYYLLGAKQGAAQAVSEAARLLRLKRDQPFAYARELIDRGLEPEPE